MTTLRTTLAALTMAFVAAPVMADFTVTPMATYQFFDSKKGRDDNAGLGLSAGYQFNNRLSGELHYGQTKSEGVTDKRLSLDYLYTFNPDAKLSPFVLLGAGQERTDGYAYKGTLVNAAVGAFYDITKTISLRGEIREVYTTDKEFSDQIIGLGVQFALGASVAEAQQTVAKAQEKAAVAEQKVEALAAVVLDSDNDGVKDDADQCPSTPAGTAVDATGCLADADKDGVTDAADQCPSTPAGLSVDATGCVADADKDGVADNLDQCPSTAEGVVVDEKGCDKILTEAISKKLSITFDSGKAIVKDEFKADIADVAKLLKQYPSAAAEIQGHTDSSGKAAANDKLSQDRADAVKAVLVNEFGITADRITAKGYGSSQPVTDNATAEGRAQNRRVMAIIAGETTRVLTK